MDSPTQKQIDIRDYWRILMKRSWIWMTFLVVVVATTAVFTLTQIPIYRATAQILIEKMTLSALPTNEMMVIDTSGPEFYKTQSKIMESRSLAKEVIKRLSLERYPEFRPKKKMWFGLFEEPDTAVPDDSTVANIFASKLQIEFVPNSRLMAVNFESVDPQLAAQAANALVQAYIDWNLGLRIKAQQNVSFFLDEQVKEARRKLEATEQALQQYREKYGVAVLNVRGGRTAEGAQDVSRQKLMQVNAQLVDATKNRIEAEIKYKNALDLLKSPERAESIPEAVNSPVIIAIKEQEVKLLREKAEKSEKFGPKHHMMISLNQEIENLRKKKLDEIRNIVDAMRGKYEITLRQEQSLQKALGQSQEETINRDKVAIQYQVLQQEVDSNRSLYDMLLKRLKETNVTEESRSINIHVVDLAEPPKSPAKPRVHMNIILAIITGLVIGGGLAFFAEYLDNTIKTPDDLKRYFNLPYLGPVPNFKIGNSRDPQPELVLLNDPKSQASESYRGIRTGILFSTPGHSPKSILITSCGAGEGKTITSANLAIAMAQGGQRILMVDCDMRRPRLHKVFKLDNAQGLSNTLVGICDWREAIHSSLVTNLSIMTSGPIAPNPAELIGSDRMNDLIKKASSEYDRIIFDSSPVGAVTDPVILSRAVDGVVLVIKMGETIRDMVSNSLIRLNDVKAHILGAILNDVHVGKNNYYYYQYYYHYYGDGDEKKKKRKSGRSKENAAKSV